MKIRQDNDVTDHIGLLYIKKWNWTIVWFDRVLFMKNNKLDIDVTDCTGGIHAKIGTEWS